MTSLFEEPFPEHPARYSKNLRPLLREWIEGYKPILDPMAGVGTLQVPGMIYSELEWGWVRQCPHPALQSDAVHLPFARDTFGAIVCSPPYGNRMADNYAGDAKGSTRYTYRVMLGQPLRRESIAGLQWGKHYRQVMTSAWEEVYRVLREGGRFVLNVKDHYRNNKLQQTHLWHVGVCERIGFTLLDERDIPCPGQRFGENSNLRVEVEKVYLLGKEEPWKELPTAP